MRLHGYEVPREVFLFHHMGNLPRRLGMPQPLHFGMHGRDMYNNPAAPRDTRLDGSVMQDHTAMSSMNEPHIRAHDPNASSRLMFFAHQNNTKLPQARVGARIWAYLTLEWRNPRALPWHGSLCRG